ncbi:hypothetical protein [Streptomyces sp. AHA2]|uniref:hypothetical protein n=1 Tax=Streptomyces sp. AHA2 TaxID=3064526 RepID=UPI002FE3E5D0
MRRYRITQKPPDWRQEVTRNGEAPPPRGDRPWVILDQELQGYCTLPDGDERYPLEWRTKAGANAWLVRCYRMWGNVPLMHGEHEPYNPKQERV